jgi:hypothetical protein
MKPQHRMAPGSVASPTWSKILEAIVTQQTLVPLLSEALEAHGGLARWRAFDGLSSTIVTGGKLWPLKGVHLIPTPRRAVTDFHRQWTTVTPFGEPDWTMTWTPEHVAVSNGAGATVAERDAPRGTFGGHDFETPWDPLHLAYFNGYAMWLYHAAPFILAEPGYEVTDVNPVMHEGETLRGINVVFPAAIHSHSREQQFYFGADGLLARHDYVVDVWASTPAAHFVSDYVEVEGLMFPTRRSAFLRNPDGSLQRDFNAVTVQLSDYRLRRCGEPH